MDFTFTNGTEEQQQQFLGAVNSLLNFNLDRWDIDVDVEWVADPTPGEHNEFAYTDADTPGAASIRIRQDAPGFPLPWEMPFANEVIVHELAHALLGSMEESLKTEIAAMFGTTPAAWSQEVAWEHKPLEGICETFKDAFLSPSLRSYTNRTKHLLPIPDLAEFRRLWRKGGTGGAGEPPDPGLTDPAESRDVFLESPGNPAYTNSGDGLHAFVTDQWGDPGDSFYKRYESSSFSPPSFQSSSQYYLEAGTILAITWSFPSFEFWRPPNESVFPLGNYDGCRDEGATGNWGVRMSDLDPYLFFRWTIFSEPSHTPVLDRFFEWRTGEAVVLPATWGVVRMRSSFHNLVGVPTQPLYNGCPGTPATFSFSVPASGRYAFRSEWRVSARGRPSRFADGGIDVATDIWPLEPSLILQWGWPDGEVPPPDDLPEGAIQPFTQRAGQMIVPRPVMGHRIGR